MSDLILRPAAGDDIEDVVTFWRIAAENSARPVDTTQAMAALLARDPEALILAHQGGRLVGTIIAGWDGWRGHLYRLAVDPDRRHEGIARRLVEAAEQRLRDLGATRVNAMVLDENHAAHAAWQRLGYTAQDDWSRWIKPLA